MKQRRKSKSAVIYISVGTLLIIAIALLGISVFLRITEIEVTGASRYSEDDIILASGISQGNNIMFLDTDNAVRRIRSEMPYINEVTVVPVPPDAIRITVVESTAIATIVDKNEVLLIDSSGRILARVDAAPKGLIEIVGFQPVDAEVGSRLRAALGSETQLQYLTDVLVAFERAGIADKVLYFDVGNISNIRFGYSGRFTVILGGSGNALHKLTQLTTKIIPDIEENDSTGANWTINMSDPGGVWTWRLDL